jgi:membrane protein involved in colicin uptake
MTTSTIVWIVVAVVVALLLIAAIVVMANRRRTRQRHLEAESIRERAREETTGVERREALAAETAAKARAAQAEAEAKAAEAARLQERAGTHRSDAAASRDELDEQYRHADRIDPSVRRTENAAEDQELGTGQRQRDEVRSTEEAT